MLCSRSCRISARDCTKNTRPELLSPADPNPPQLTSSAHPQCLATTAFYWLKFSHPPSPLLSYSTGELRNLKNSQNTPMSDTNASGPPFWGRGGPKRWSMFGAADQFIMTIIPKEALAVLLTLGKDDRTFWSRQFGSSEEPTELNMLTTRGSVATTSWRFSLREGSHEVLAPF